LLKQYSTNNIIKVFNAVTKNYKAELYLHYTVFQKKRSPEAVYYNFAKIVLISIKIDTHNLHIT